MKRKIKTTERKQSGKHPEVISEKINALHKSLRKTEHTNLSSTPKKRRRRDSFFEVKRDDIYKIYNSKRKFATCYGVQYISMVIVTMFVLRVEKPSRWNKGLRGSSD
ncbi:unnamed protein product [Onchocerca flexuosa]|uniref:Transposase n=1 Tax=Onchocerca flexuosa TaxID=387005 RepID=A0A183GZL7_9BILA|nr:unnamed protein product [Onchocerca flexuosa]